MVNSTISHLLFTKKLFPSFHTANENEATFSEQCVVAYACERENRAAAAKCECLNPLLLLCNSCVVFAFAFQLPHFPHVVFFFLRGKRAYSTFLFLSLSVSRFPFFSLCQSKFLFFTPTSPSMRQRHINIQYILLCVNVCNVIRSHSPETKQNETIRYRTA